MTSLRNILSVQRVPNISPMKYETLRRLMQKTNEQSVITPSTNWVESSLPSKLFLTGVLTSVTKLKGRFQR